MSCEYNEKWRGLSLEHGVIRAKLKYNTMWNIEKLVSGAKGLLFIVFAHYKKDSWQFIFVNMLLESTTDNYFLGLGGCIFTHKF